MTALDIAQAHLRHTLRIARQHADIAEKEAERARLYVLECEKAMNRFLLNKYPETEHSHAD